MSIRNRHKGRQTAELWYSLEQMPFATHERLMKRLDQKGNGLKGLVGAPLHSATNCAARLPQWSKVTLYTFYKLKYFYEHLNSTK